MEDNRISRIKQALEAVMPNHHYKLDGVYLDIRGLSGRDWVRISALDEGDAGFSWGGPIGSWRRDDNAVIEYVLKKIRTL